MKDDADDLVTPLEKIVLDNIQKPSGDAYMLEINGHLHLYHHEEDLFLAQRMSERLRSEIGWFEKVITHAPSVGSFYEDTIRSLVKEKLPAGMRAGTGFVFNPTTKKHSKQIDILISDQSMFAPLYSKGEFKVITPEMSKFHSEIKKSLTLQHVREIIQTTFTSYYGTHPRTLHGCHKIAVFALSSTVKDQRIFEEICNQIEIINSKFQSRTKKGDAVRFPFEHLVLPQFYFFDRNTYFETTLKKTSNNHYKIVVSQNSSDSSEKDSFSDYLSSVEQAVGTKSEMDRNFLTSPIRNIGKEREVCEISVLRRISMLEISNCFNNEQDETSKFRHRGNRPFGAMISAEIPLEDYPSFCDFQKDVLVWLSNKPNREL